MPDQTKMVVTNTTPSKALNSAMDKETANAMRAFIEKVSITKSCLKTGSWRSNENH